MASIASSRLHAQKHHLHLSPEVLSVVLFILAACTAIGLVVWLALATAGSMPSGMMMMH
jgi:hypothetical protein